MPEGIVEEKPLEDDGRYEPIVPKGREEGRRWRVRRREIILVLVTLAVVSLLLGATMLAVYSMGDVVGEWHLTEMSSPLYMQTVDEYICFHSNRTGWWQPNSGERENFQWKHVASGVLNLTFDDGSYLIIRYEISGDKITMKFTGVFGEEATLKGYRVR